MKNILQTKVFVVDCEGKPCLPTKPRRARQLLDQKRAKVKMVVPFTIQLIRKIDNPVGSFEFGVDDGALYVGIAIKNQKTEEVVFRAQCDHRQDVSLLMGQRRDYRRARRGRLRYRQPRFSNRIKSKIAPSIRQRKEVILRILKDFRKRLNITKVKVEEVFFNHYEHTWGKFFSLVEIGKTFLKQEILKIGLPYEHTYGYITKAKRLELGLSKRHANDACAIVGSNKLCGPEYYIKPRRTKISLNRTCNEKQGFRHYDLVEASHRTRGTVIGSVASLSTKSLILRTKFSDKFPVSYKKSKLLQRFNGLIYSY